MISLRVSSHSLFHARRATLKFFSSHSLLSFLLLVVCLAQSFSIQSMLTFLVFSSVPLFLIRSKFHQSKVSDRLPVISVFQHMGVFCKFLRHRASARIMLMEIMMGVCQWFMKEGKFLFTMCGRTFMALYNADAVESVLSSNTILQKGFPYGMLKQFTKEGLLTSDGNKWHVRRRRLTPSFHFKILDQFILGFNKQSNRFVKKIDDLMQKQESIDIMPLASDCAMDILLETTMGKRVNTEEAGGKEYCKALRTWSICMAKRVPYPWLWFDFIFHRTKDGKISQKCLNTAANFTNEMIKERLRERSEGLMNIKKIDFSSLCTDIGRKTKPQLALLDLLVDLHLQDDSFSLQDIAEEIDTFLVAGHDTTSRAISWVLYLLGLHPDVQKKAQEEVDVVLGDDANRIITTEDIRQLKYLHCILKETLRLYPPVPVITRTVNEDAVICGHDVRKGTTTVILIYTLHRNPVIFPNPEKFNPERFSPENVKKRHPFAYVPFSAGPRNCIGQRFATNNLLTVLATVLRHYNVISIEHRDKVVLVADIVLTPEKGIWLRFTKRQFLRKYPD